MKYADQIKFFGHLINNQMRDLNKETHGKSTTILHQKVNIRPFGNSENLICSKKEEKRKRSKKYNLLNLLTSLGHF